MRKIVMLGTLLVVGSVAFVMSRPEEAPETAFDRKVRDRSATLHDWANASSDEKGRFLKVYATHHLGSEDLRRQTGLRHGIDSTVKHIQKRPLDPEARTEALERGLLWDTAAFTAEMLNWPAAK